MKIYLATRTAGEYGGGLRGNLMHFDRLIQNELDRVGFIASFDTMYLTLSYPPMYVLPAFGGMPIDNKTYIDTPPTSRLDRRHKQIDVDLNAPELSENQHKANQINYEHKLDIEDRYKNISESELAKVLIDKYLQAAEIINTKLSKGDCFDMGAFKNTLISLRDKINPEFIVTTIERLAIEVRNETINRAINLREKRKISTIPKDKRIRDFRVYSSFPKKSFYPYDYQYSEIFLNILRNKQLLCPVHHHLYIQIDKSLEDCLMKSIPYDHWYVYGLAVIDYNIYLKLDEKAKEQVVFNLLTEGLRDIADIDKLDTSIIESTIEEIKLKGLDTELVYMVIDNKNHKLTITYFSRSMDEKCSVYFNLLDKQSGQQKRTLIGRATNSEMYFWLQKVNVTKTHIKVKSSSSIEADVNLKDMPRNMEFTIKDLIHE